MSRLRLAKIADPSNPPASALEIYYDTAGTGYNTPASLAAIDESGNLAMLAHFAVLDYRLLKVRDGRNDAPRESDHGSETAHRQGGDRWDDPDVLMGRDNRGEAGGCQARNCGCRETRRQDGGSEPDDGNYAEARCGEAGCGNGRRKSGPFSRPRRGHGRRPTVAARPMSNVSAPARRAAGQLPPRRRHRWVAVAVAALMPRRGSRALLRPSPTSAVLADREQPQVQPGRSARIRHGA